MADVVKIVNKGLELITGFIKNAASEPNHMGWGVGVTAAAETDTALETERPEPRVAGTSTQETTTTTNDTYQVVGTLTAAGTSAAITEVGLFDADAAGNLFLRATFDAINVGVGDSIQFTIKSVFDQA